MPINRTVPQMLKAGMPVSDERLESEIRSMRRTGDHYVAMIVRKSQGQALPTDYILSQDRRQRFLDEFTWLQSIRLSRL